jgi:hypothetical protein
MAELMTVRLLELVNARIEAMASRGKYLSEGQRLGQARKSRKRKRLAGPPRALKLRNRHAETRISSLEAQPASTIAA